MFTTFKEGMVVKAKPVNCLLEREGCVKARMYRFFKKKNIKGGKVNEKCAKKSINLLKLLGKKN